MHIKLDWLSFTVRREVGEDDNEHVALNQVTAEIDALCEVWRDVFGSFANGKWQSGRKPYNASYALDCGGVVIFVHPKLDHALVEVTGRGCEMLGETAHGWAFLNSVKNRLTRLDLACDMFSDTNPLDFVAEREDGRFKAHSEVVSESGTTCYVGSRTSNRYARVYRYNPPHERSHLLRCEYVVKAEDARRTAQAVLDTDPYTVANSLGNQFGWLHSDWDVKDVSEIELRAYRPDRHQGKTLFWLNKTVAPLLRRLHRAGDIDATKWLQEFVLSDTVDDDIE